MLTERQSLLGEENLCNFWTSQGCELEVMGKDVLLHEIKKMNESLIRIVEILEKLLFDCSAK